MWQRFKRMIRSVFGAFISIGEDPERILQQNIRDMNDQVPQMNAQIAMVRANLTLVEKEAERYHRELADLTNKLKAALSQGREDLAMEFALQLENVKGHAARSKGQAATARGAYEKALDVKKAFMREKEQKTREAMDALRQARQAKWQAQVADVMQSFEPAGIDATHDEMVRKVEEQAALDSAQLDMAIQAPETGRADIEAEAERMRAKEILAQFKMEMGLTDKSTTAKQKSTAGSGGKTIARSRKKSKA